MQGILAVSTVFYPVDFRDTPYIGKYREVLSGPYLWLCPF